jgi:hypothetical protein
LGRGKEQMFESDDSGCGGREDGEEAGVGEPFDADGEGGGVGGDVGEDLERKEGEEVGLARRKSEKGMRKRDVRLALPVGSSEKGVPSKWMALVLKASSVGITSEEEGASSRIPRAGERQRCISSSYHTDAYRHVRADYIPSIPLSSSKSLAILPFNIGFSSDNR